MDQQNHFFSIIAVFLALGIGILIGASMGENALVQNQIAVIEGLKSEIRHYKDEIKDYFTSLALLEEELLQWEALEENYLNPLLLEDKLLDHVVKVLVLEEMPGELYDFLELTGAAYHLYIFAAEFNEKGQPVLAPDFAGEERIINDRAELYSALGNELALPSGTGQGAGEGGILDFLREKKLLEIVSGPKTPPNTKSAARAQEYGREIFIAGSFPGRLLDHLAERVGAERVIIWQDFVGSINIIAGAKGDPASFAGRGAGPFFSRLKLLELINNGCGSA